MTRPHVRRKLPVAAIAAAGLLLGTLFATPAAEAVGPSNDNFATPIVLNGVSTSIQGDNTSATVETGEPLTSNYGDAVGQTLWYRWTAPVTGSYAISVGAGGYPTGATSATGFDTVVSVYTGSALTSLNRVATNDDNLILGGNVSATGFAATAGTTYDIQVGGYTTHTGTFLLTLGAADATGTITYEAQSAYGSNVDPEEGCLGFYTDNTFTTLVASGCGSGNAGSSAASAVGLVPPGTYYLKAYDGPTTTYYPGGTSTAAATPITIPGGGCTLTGLNVNFTSKTFSAPSGRTCPFVPACQQATGAASQASTTLAVANAALNAAQAQVTADQRAIAATKRAIKKAKKKHRPTAALTKRLTRLTQRLAVDNATLNAARTAAAFAAAGQTSAQAAVNGSC